MTPSNIELLIAILGAMGIISLSLVGLKIFVGAWIKRKEIATGGDASQLLEALEALRSDQDELRTQLGGEISDLHERLDFAERLLTKGQYDPKHEPER